MKLSIVIVNYNVKYFLEQCLHSVMKACEKTGAEIFVVDNNSVDGSVKMVEEKFPSVKIIANHDNKGFSKANNQAIRESTSEYILLLNPDTIVEEDTFEKIVRFMDSHPEAGGLGVKMIDGSGTFLPESKRGLPTPDVAFYKIFGLSKIFPKSKTFGRYHLGFLEENKINEVDVLAGAFMLIRKTVLDKIGLLDEDFFMYGEDIDLSYRITKAGFKNYYFPETRIIHYKGESTKRSSVNYVFVFYNAMIIFAQKHFSKSNASLFSFFIKTAIYIRAGAALFSRFIKRTIIPAADFILLLAGLFFLKDYWGTNFGIRFPFIFIEFAAPFYCLLWMTTVFFSGGYDYPVRLLKVIRGIFTGTLLILVIYALLPEEYRFSRALILLGALWAGIAMTGLRFLISLFARKHFALASDAKKRLLIVGDDDEGTRVLSLLKLTESNHNFIGFVKPDTISSKKYSTEYEKYFLGDAKNLRQIADIYSIDEMIFCGKDVSSQQIIRFMSLNPAREVEYKIAPPESLFIIGSSSVESTGELYVVDINNINKSVNRRNKRLVDIVMSVFFLVLSPIFIFMQKKPLSFLKNIFSVIFGYKSWVGYSGENKLTLPKIRKGILSPLDGLKKRDIDEMTISRLNALYAKDYRVYTDFLILRKAWRNLGS